VTSITLEEAQSKLAELIAGLKPGETIEIRQGEHPIACLTGSGGRERKRRVPGSAIGRLQVVTEDDEHLADFGEYMP